MFSSERKYTQEKLSLSEQKKAHVGPYYNETPVVLNL